ncbi:hypothetical protein A8709_00535 [Paenibacillus pectinilyticus]|uniref:Rhodanese domain-containing protein n=1 Tax=Paenibacillus pectinilyticus TaxID=512399 RepID=A0A1C1A8A5_9BACL|nr:hypothetical protein A8709_00535 [Paenibacillus pectinilyticus]
MSAMPIQADRILACEGLACPLPVVRTKKAIDEMKEGEVVEVRVTDKGSVADLKGWTQGTGHQYVGLKEENGIYRHFIRKAEASETKSERKHPHTISNEELQAKLAAGEQLHMIDVREPAEYAFGRIPGAVSLPLGELTERLSDLSPDHDYYVICRTGRRSDMACQLLAEHGFGRVTNVTPGMSEWTFEMEKDKEEDVNMVHLTVDAKGLACPMPIVKAKKGIDSMESGQIMELLTTDKGSMKDFQAWVGQTKHELLEATESNGVFTFIVRKR